MKNKIRQFIDENNLSFEEGERNSSVTILCGYSLHINTSKEKLINELDKEIKLDNTIAEEIERIWTFCKKNKYGEFWKTPEAQHQYKY